MGKAWSDDAIRKLEDWTTCPRCDAQAIEGGVCTKCNADLRTSQASRLADASKAAVLALQTRQRLLGTLTDAVAAPTRAAAARPAPVVTAPQPGAVGSTSAASSQISVQSVLAIAGAGLFAVAAIVFTFLTPTITQSGRSTIVAIITVVFLAGAWLLARARLQFSAEAVGALGMVFVVLDVWSFSRFAAPDSSGWFAIAIGTAVASTVMIALAAARRLRTWLWAGLVGLALAPAFVGYGLDSAWSVLLGHLAVGFVSLALHELIGRLRTRFDSTLRADHGTMTVLQFVVLPIVLVQLVLLPGSEVVPRVLGASAVVLAIAVLAALSTRNSLREVWSFFGGAAFTLAVGLLPLLLIDGDHDVWIIALAPVATTIAIAALAAATLRLGDSPSLHRPTLLGGAWAIGWVALLAPAITALFQFFTATSDALPGDFGIAAVYGLVASALGAVVLFLLNGRSVAVLAIALWTAVAALTTLAGWSVLSDIGHVAVALGLGVALSLLVFLAPAVRTATVAVRLPIVVGAHVLVLYALITSWRQADLTVYGGIAVVVALGVLALSVPALVRPVHTGVAFGYALVVTAVAMNNGGVGVVANLCVTAAIACAVALAVTLVKRVPAAYWWAVLTIAAIPFLGSIVQVLIERSGWTALSTGVAFVLAVTIVLVQRPGLGLVVRAGAASMLVPALAVVTLSLGAEYLKVSASPITLPIIAGLVALTLPTTGLVGLALERRGIPAMDARAVRLWIEVSSLVTAALAVVLALVRTASGFGTTFLVLVIIGLGAAATGQFMHRRYAWVVAWISFTGAMWSLLALNGVDILEPYVLPPAAVAVIIGSVAAARGRNGAGFFAAGLGVATFTPLLILATQGNGNGVVEWRAWALLLGAAVLVAVGFVLGRSARGSQPHRLRFVALVVAIVAASAGTVQALRYGLGVDAATLASPQSLIFVALLFGGLGTVLAAIAGRLLARDSASRWWLAPAVLFIVPGTASAMREGTTGPIVMLALTLLLLAFMLVAVVRGTGRTTTLPPVWYIWSLAWVAAVAGWSDRDLFRVEAFSLPLGLALVAAGVIAARRATPALGTLNSWPDGHSGSWRLYGPGIVVTLLPSALATGTDPQTLRAILVIALALTAILLGNRLRLAAPFWLGIGALPVEIIIVFAAQIGTNIDAATWWITLATAGAVLLILAVSTERRTGADASVGARLRDLA